LQGALPPRLAVARVEQGLEPLENVPGQVEVRDEEAMLERGGASPALDRVDEDVEVLPHFRIGFRFSPRRQHLQHASRRSVIALRILRIEVEHRGIEAIDAQFRRELGVESASISITIAELRSLASIQGGSAAAAARGTQSIADTRVRESKQGLR